MDINKFITTNYTGKDIQQITSLKLNDDVLTNIIYKIKQKIKNVKNFEQLYSHVRIIINDLNIKDKELTIDKINKFLYNQLYIDIDITALRKNIIEDFNNSDSCSNIKPIICSIDAYDKRYNCASSKYTSNGDFIDNPNNYVKGNPWHSAHKKDNKKICTVDRSQCPRGLTLGKDQNGMNVCIHEAKTEYKYAINLESYAENKWYEWFTIPNFHLGNKFIEDKNDNNIPLLLQPCGCTPGEFEFDKIPYTEFINKCMHKIDYKFGAYTDAMPYSPIAAVCLLGAPIDNILNKYHRDLYDIPHCNLPYNDTFKNTEVNDRINDSDQNEKLIFTDAYKKIKNIGTQFLISEYYVSIPNSYELPKSIYAFDVDQISFAYDIASNVSFILNKRDGFNELSNKFDYTIRDGIGDDYDNNIHGGRDNKLFKENHVNELIKACKICFSLTFKIEESNIELKGFEKVMKMDYIYDLFSNKTNMFAVDVVNKLQIKHPDKGYLSFDIYKGAENVAPPINSYSMYSQNFLRTDIPSTVPIPFRYNKSLLNVISYTQIFLVYLFTLICVIVILYIVYKLWTLMYTYSIGYFDSTEASKAYNDNIKKCN